MALRVGAVILPDLRWPEALAQWRDAEARGFHTAWTYDHLSWRSLRNGPWLGTVPLLAAVAASTTTLRIGTLVTSPNFRHPALLAKDAMTLDEISASRLELGIGAGGPGYDMTALGGPTLSPKERSDRFADFTAALDVMLREPIGSYAGSHFQAPGYRTVPGCTQQPRVPFTIAATGPRGFRLAARYASCWVTVSPGSAAVPGEWFDEVRRQVTGLRQACEDVGRDPDDLRRMALVSLDAAWAQSTSERWREFNGRLAALGFTDVAVHRPRPHDAALPGCDPDVFDAITEGLREEAHRTWPVSR
jgi:alkanesulfonate monooxygenase SsuD/methylene tetrahydromethanopterin reductase-like flavin-dependent oxidoreductase (luciferase family)